MERVEQRKGDIALVIAPVNRIDAHVMQEVVHPPHVPFEPEPESPEISRTRHTRPGGRFLSDGDDPGELFVTKFVKPLEKIYGLKVFPATVNVGERLPGLARVIEVKHRGHGVHAQTVDVIFVEPEKRVTDQKIPHFVASKIKNEGTPVLMLALARIHMLIEMGAVEPGERMCVLRKMRRYPVHNHANSGLMAFIDEMTEVVWRTKPA